MSPTPDNPFVSVIQEALKAAQDGSLAPDDFATMLYGIAEALEAISTSGLVDRWWAKAALMTAAAGLRQLADETQTKHADDTAPE